MSNVYKLDTTKPVSTLSNIIKKKPAWRLLAKQSVIEMPVKIKLYPGIPKDKLEAIFELSRKKDKIEREAEIKELIESYNANLADHDEEDRAIIDMGFANWDLIGIKKKDYEKMQEHIENTFARSLDCGHQYTWTDESSFAYHKKEGSTYIALTVSINEFSKVPLAALKKVLMHANDDVMDIQYYLDNYVSMKKAK